VNSEIVLVFDTITTLVDVGLDGGGVTQRSDDQQLEAELAELAERLQRELRVGLGERSSSVSCAKTGVLSALSGWPG
jgi:hypothetical protein